ncbi:MAG: inositol monophosphatase family protein [Archangium sp.]
MVKHELALLAESIARDAGKLLRDKFSETRTVSYKGERHTDLVTDADKASEALILARLQQAVPTHGVLAEESGDVRSGDHRWFVDPLDGTTNYAHAVPHFCVTIGVEDRIGMLAGCIYDPLRDECFVAARGEGAFLNQRRLETSKAPGMSRALMCTGFPYDVTQNPEAPLGLFTRIVSKAQGIRRMGSAALDLAYVAAGRYDGFFEFGLKPWDTSAGSILITEAGGVIHAIDGSTWAPESLDILACGKPLEAELVPLCRDFVSKIGWKPRRFSV